MTEQALSRTAAAEAVAALDWRYLPGSLRTAVPVDSLATAVLVAALATDACGEDADPHLNLALRPSQVRAGKSCRCR